MGSYGVPPDPAWSAQEGFKRWFRRAMDQERVSALHEPLHWKAKRDPKARMLSLQSFLRKGVSLGYAGSI